MLVTSLVFVPQRLQSDLPAFPSNPPAWSILAELAANTAHALILVRLSCRSLAIIAASCLGSLMLLTPDLDRGVMTGEFALGLLRVGFGYTLGVLLWRVWGDRALMRPTTALVALPALILLGSQLGGWYDFLFVALLCPLIILCCLGESKAGTFLGPLSFPLYAVHYPVTHWVIIVMGGPAWLAASLAILVSAPLALFFEPAGRRWARKRFKQSLQVGAEPASSEI
jgi:peptidoglycan/LPS O-acetylase OafA/YrhL